MVQAGKGRVIKKKVENKLMKSTVPQSLFRRLQISIELVNTGILSLACYEKTWRDAVHKIDFGDLLTRIFTEFVIKNKSVSFYRSGQIKIRCETISAQKFILGIEDE